MKFSIIVPVFNTGQYVDRCVNALLAQDYPRDQFEIIAVDNGSSDDSLERLGKYSRVKIVQEAKRGSYAARNAGAARASGALLAFTDSDCAPRPDWLQQIEAYLERNSCQVVQGARQVVADSGLLSSINEYEVTKDAFTMAGQVAEKYYGYTNNMGMTRETWVRYGPFVERDRGADTIFVRSVVDGETCDAVVFNPDMVVQHLEMDGFIDYARKMFIYGRSRKRYRFLKQTEALDFRDRLQIFSRVTRDKRYSPWRTCKLAAALACSMMAWQLGSWAGAFESKGKGR